MLPSLAPLARLRRALCLLAICLAGNLVGADTLRVFYIGNSVTDTIRYDALAELARSRGDTIVWSRHMVPGAPLSWIWQKGGGFTKREFGPAPEALANHDWDAVVAQPFDRHLTSTSGEGDLEVIQEMIKLQAGRNPAARFYVYSRWPRMVGLDGKSFKFDQDDYDPSTPGSRPDLSGVQAWSSLWERRYKPGAWDGSNESRDYFERVVAGLRDANPQLAHPVGIVPVGDVLHALDRKMARGEVPGFDTVWLFYKDGVHMNDHGSYVAALTFYATLLKKAPLGLSTSAYGGDKISPALAQLIQETVWEIVSRHPLTGVKAP